jgi:hypothetical protein
MKDLKEIKRLTIINIVDNETDPLSSPCVCCGGGNSSTSSTSSSKNSKGINEGGGNSIENKEDDNNNNIRTCAYTQEIMTVMSHYSRNIGNNEGDTSVGEDFEKKSKRRSKKGAPIDFNSMCHAAHGLSLLLIAEYDDTKTSYLLFDGGPDPELWRRNVQKLKIDLSQINNIVLSHYHIDHSNGLRSAVHDICQAKEGDMNGLGKGNYEEQVEEEGTIISPLMIDLHPSTIKSRGIKIRGKVHKMLPDNPTPEELASLGGVVKFFANEHLVGDDCFYVSGKIPRKTSFEVRPIIYHLSIFE